MNNPTTYGYNPEESIRFFTKQLERTKKHAKMAKARNATVEEMAALGYRMRQYKAAIAAFKVLGGKSDD
jgi:hypothetical protein